MVEEKRTASVGCGRLIPDQDQPSWISNQDQKLNFLQTAVLFIRRESLFRFFWIYSVVCANRIENSKVTN
jgi:hypothetical protein